MVSGNQQFISHLEAGGTVVTANRRQSRIIRRLYDEAQLAAGRRCWPAADVVPLDGWLAARWDELTGADPRLPTLLSDAEALWTWREAAPRFEESTLVAEPDLAAAARRAWLQLRRHGATLDDLDAEFLTRDQQLFQEWARSVESGHVAAGWIDPGLLELAIADQAAHLGELHALLLAGFDPPRPALKRLMERLTAGGVEILRARPAVRPCDARSFAAADTADETRAWLGWLRGRLSTRPEARLAVIVPDLQARRAAIERALDAVLLPELELPGNRERDRPYDLAGGEPLTGFGIAASALGVLACLAPRVDWDTFSRLLRSRYTPAQDDRDARVRLDVELREHGVASWPLPRLTSAARQRGCHGVAAALEATQRLLYQGPERRGTDDWAQVFGNLLTAWEWPGDGPLESDEFQAADALRQRLAEFATHSRLAPRLGIEQARSEFARLVEAPFQPERGAPSVWILDALEPAGVEFDGLWVSGLTAATWPEPARHDAFLPLPLQRRLGMPGVSAEDSMQRALAAIEAWRHGAAEVVFSWPRRQDDADVEPSRVLPAGLASADPPPGPETRAERLQRAHATEAAPVQVAPPLAGPAAGGARILELQAKCPFRAFAELRLHAAPLEEPSAGVDRRVRGIVLHATLEQVWRELGDHATLARLTPTALEALVERCLEAALQKHLPAELGSRGTRLERDWQRAAALHVLQLDLGREAFEVVATEEALRADLAGLSLRLRVDRVDRVGGGLVVLDYKTGRTSTSQWRGTRPDAPQLPLYAILKGGEVGGVAFLTASSQGATVRGVAREAQRLPGMDPAERFALTDAREKGFGWDEIRRHWQAWLTALAGDYRLGRAEVDPKLPDTCSYCHLQTLCRVAPGFEAGDTQEGEDD